MRAAVYAGTRNIYQNMIPSMKSLLKYSNVEKIYFLIEDDQFPYELPPEVECINVSKQQWFTPDGPNFTSKWSYMILLRAALTQLFPHLDKILSLDCDTLVQDNISELWDLPLDDYYFAGVREPKKSTEEFVYINAGVMMFNLKKIREEHQDEKYIYDLNNCFRYFPEQECFSALSQGKILELPSKYNLSCVSNPSVEEKIVHFAAYKQWPTLRIVQEFEQLPLDLERNKVNNINLNGSYILFMPQNAIITQDNINYIIETIKQNSAGYMYLWNDNCLAIRRDFIHRYNINTDISIHGLIRLSETILLYLQKIDYCKRIFIFKENLVNSIEDFSPLVKDTVQDYYYLLNKCKELKIPMSYVIRELNYGIVWLYWLFLRTIQEAPQLAKENWKLIKEFYDLCYSKYELTASATLAEPYYKINTQLIRLAMRQWKNPVRININKFLSELKIETDLPRRYEFD